MLENRFFSNRSAIRAVLPLTSLIGIASAQTYSVIYNFDSAANDPAVVRYTATLSQGRDGSVYGTSDGGGAQGFGSSFAMSITSDQPAVLYSFPTQEFAAGMTLGSDGNYYGITNAGGTNNFGQVFQLTPAGTFKTVHSFTGGN